MPSMPNFKTSVNLIGDLEKWIEQSTEKVETSVAESIKDHAEKVLETAKELVPVDQGLLRDTLQVKISKDGLHAVVKTDGKRAPHGHLVHFGTVKMKGRPFLYQAGERHENELAPAIKQRLGKEAK